MTTGIMDPIKRAEAELEALMGGKKADAAIPDNGQGAGNPGDEPAPGGNPDDPGKQPVNNEPAHQPNAEPPKTEDANYWRQRFEVMQGKYNAEVPRLVEQVNTLNTQMQELVSQKGQTEEVTGKRNVSAEEALANLHDTYGSELTDAIDALIHARMQGVEEKVSKVETATAQTAAEKFFGYLDEHAEGWKALNTDPGFLSFLETEDDISGIPYKAIITNAFNNGNAGRVAKIFNHYKQINNLGTPPSSKGGNEPPKPDALAAPPKRGGSGQPPANAQSKQDRVFKMAEINAFYKNLELGRYRGKEAEAQALEHEILLANQQGRIVG